MPEVRRSATPRENMWKDQQPIIINSAHYEKALWIQAPHLPRLPSSDWAACLRPEPLSSMHLAQPLLPAKEVEVPLRGRFSL